MSVTGLIRGGREASNIAISKALRRVGICKREIKTHKGSKKLFALRNSESWAKRTDKDWAAHYKEHDCTNKFKGKEKDEEKMYKSRFFARSGKKRDRCSP